MCIKKAEHAPLGERNTKIQVFPFSGPVFEIAQVGSRKRGQKTGTLSNARKPNQTECFYLKEDV